MTTGKVSKKSKCEYALSPTADELWIRSPCRRFSHRVDPDHIYWPVVDCDSNVALIYTSPPSQAEKYANFGEEFEITQTSEEAPILSYETVSEETREISISPWFSQKATLTPREYYACMTLKAIVNGNPSLLLRYVVNDSQLFKHRSRQPCEVADNDSKNTLHKNLGVMYPFLLNKDCNGGIDPATGRPIPHGSTTPVSTEYLAQRPPSVVYRIRVVSDHSGEEDSGALTLFKAQEAVIHQITAPCIEVVQQAIMAHENQSAFLPILNIDPTNYAVMDVMAELTRDRDDSIAQNTRVDGSSAEQSLAVEEDVTKACSLHNFRPACCDSFQKESSGMIVKNGLQVVPRVHLDKPMFGGVPDPPKGSADARRVDVFLACLADSSKDPSTYKSRKRCMELSVLDTSKDETIDSLQLEIETLKTEAADNLDEIALLSATCEEKSNKIKKLEEAQVVHVKEGQKVVLASGCFLYAPGGQDVLVTNQGNNNEVVKLSCPCSGAAQVFIPAPLPGPYGD